MRRISVRIPRRPLVSWFWADGWTLKQRERCSEDASSRAEVRECAWRGDPVGGLARRRAAKSNTMRTRCTIADYLAATNKLARCFVMAATGIFERAS